MPEFILDTSGAVEGFAPAFEDIAAGRGESVAWHDLSPFVQGYIEALFFTNEGDGTPGEGDEFGLWREVEPGLWSADFGFSDLAPEALAAILADCQAFTESEAFRAFEAWRDDDASEETTPADDAQAGRDFWFTRTGAGVGFWDRPAHYYGPHMEALSKLARAAGEVWPYVGDDGAVYL